LVSDIAAAASAPLTGRLSSAIRTMNDMTRSTCPTANAMRIVPKFVIIVIGRRRLCSPSETGAPTIVCLTVSFTFPRAFDVNALTNSPTKSRANAFRPAVLCASRLSSA